MLKKVLCVLVVISLLVPVFSCVGTSSQTKQSTNTLTNTQKTSLFRLSLSGIPKPGETTDVDFSPFIQQENITGKNNPIAGLVNGRAWVDFYWININGSYDQAKHGELIPLSEIIVSGKANAQGNIRETSDLKSTVKLSREGIWKIQGNVQGEGWETPESISVQIIVSDKYSGYFDRYSTALASSPLDYLQYFPYGQFGYRPLNDTTDPIILETDISKAPKPGEEATFTVKITSLYDVSNFSSEMTFAKNRGYEEVFANNLFVDGNLSWSGDLKAGKPVQYSADIKFPEEGEWSIGAIGNSKERKEQHIVGFGDSIQITINNTHSYYGWKPETSTIKYNSSLNTNNKEPNTDTMIPLSPPNPEASGEQQSLDGGVQPGTSDGKSYQETRAELLASGAVESVNERSESGEVGTCNY